MRRALLICVLVMFVLALIGAAGCEAPQTPQAPALPQAPAPLVLRSYKAPEGQEERLAATLRELIAQGEQAQGRVARGPNGQLLVAAPEGLQEGVAGLMEEAGGVAQAAPRAILLRYWFVLGQPGESGPREARLGEIGGALDGVVEAEGPMRFALLEKIAVQSMDSEFARATGRVFGVEHSATATPEAVLANLDLEVKGGNKLQTRVALKPGQTVVLSQGGFEPEHARRLLGREEPLEGAPESFVLFYVVQASLP